MIDRLRNLLPAIKLTETRAGLLGLAAFLVIFVTNPVILQEYANRFYDLNFTLRGETSAPQDVILIKIDDKSMESLGRWPWSRDVYVSLLDILNAADARVVGFDMVFSYAEQRGEKLIAEQLRQHYQQNTHTQHPDIFTPLDQVIQAYDVDSNLAAAMKRSNNVVPGYFFFTRDDDLGKIQLTQKQAYRLVRKFRYKNYKLPDTDKQNYALHGGYNVKPNIKPISRAAASSGFFNIFQDKDGRVRNVTHVMKFRDKYFPSLSIQMLSVMLHATPTLIFNEFGTDHIEFDSQSVPLNEFGQTRLNYYGKENVFQQVSFEDVIKNGNNPDFLSRFKDKVVLLGPTAIGISDFQDTPFGFIPGMQMHATFIQNFIDRNFLRQFNTPFLYELAIILVGAGLILLINHIVGIRWASIAFFTLTATLLAAQWLLFDLSHFYFNVFYPLLGLIVLHLSVMTMGFVQTRHQKQYITRAFEQYLSPEFVRSLQQDPHKLELGGEEKELSCFFTDLQGFTSLSESLDTHTLVDMVGRHFTVLTNIIHAQGGTVDKYIGDAIAAFFGAPIALPNHAQAAIAAALDGQRAIAELNQKFAQQNLPSLTVRIGINTGKVLVGNFGSRQRFNYTIMGDNANLAARLEGTNKYYHTLVCISASTREQAGDMFCYRQLDRIRVVGKRIPVAIYEPICRHEELDENTAQWLTLHQQAYDAYTQRRFADSAKLFFELHAHRPEDEYAVMMMLRCENFIQNPPPENWDGVYDLSKK